MEAFCQLEPIRSLVPINSIRPMTSVSKKYWHIVCRAEFMIPYGPRLVKLSVFLIWYNGRFYLNIVFELIEMLESAQSDLLFGDQYQLEDDDNPLPLGYGQIPIAYNVFELPSCARCLFGYSCNSHKLDQK